jgi:hypothetical protein
MEVFLGKFTIKWGDFPASHVVDVRKSLSLERVTYLVLDEADRLASGCGNSREHQALPQHV